MKTRKMKCAALLASGGMVLGFGGSCVPDDFWMDTWGGVLWTTVNTVAGAAVEAYVIAPMMDFIVPPAE